MSHHWGCKSERGAHVVALVTGPTAPSGRVVFNLCTQRHIEADELPALQGRRTLSRLK